MAAPIRMVGLEELSSTPEMTLEIANPVAFTDDAVNSIRRALKVDANPHRLTLLPNVLRSWAEVDLIEYASVEAFRASAPTVAVRYQRIARHAAGLAEAIDVVTEDNDHVLIAIELGGGYKSLEARQQCAYYTHKLTEQRAFLDQLIKAVQSVQHRLKKGRGQPRNTAAYLVLSDIAGVFEWLTGLHARREVSRKDGQEIGPFSDFASSIWPPVFASGLDGLPAAMKNWASFRRYERSPLIANIDLRQPSWRVFDR